MSGDPVDRPLRVGIGIIGRAGRFLIRQRPPGTAMAGYWEFPGGKCENEETPEETTLRECREETGLTIVVGALREVITYRYPHARVEMHYFDCGTVGPLAEPEPSTGFCWVWAHDLPGLPFPEANAPILDALAREWAVGRSR